MPAKVEIKDELLRDIRLQILSAGHGNSRQLVEKYAKDLGVSAATLYRRLDVTKGSKKSPRESKIDSALILDVGALKVQAGSVGRNKRYLRTEDAIRLAEQSGVVEPGQLNATTVNQRLRQLGFNAPRAYSRFEDSHVNQVHMLDFSVSEYFGVVKRGESDWVVTPVGKSIANPYKNKQGEQKMKLWLSALVDTWSRRSFIQYFVSPGESLQMVAEFFNACYFRNDANFEAFALPAKMELDQGAVGKSEAFTEGMRRLGVEVVLKASKSEREMIHQSGGKIERRFRSYWQSELLFHQVLQAKEIREISLTDLNLLAYSEMLKINEKAHPIVRRSSIKQRYELGLQERKVAANKGDIALGNRYLEQDIYEVLFKQQYRSVDAAGCISLNNELYEIDDKRFVMSRIQVITDAMGRMKGVGELPNGTSTSFDIWPLVQSEMKRTKPAETLRQQLTQREVALNADAVGIELTLPTEHTNVRKLTTKQVEVKAETAFTEQSEPVLGLDEAKKYLCTALGCRWNEIPEIIQTLVQTAHESGKLTQKTVDQLRKAVG